MSGARGRRGAEQGGSQGHRSRSRGTDRRSRPRPRAPLSSPGRGQREARQAWGGDAGLRRGDWRGPLPIIAPHFLASPGSQQALGGVGEIAAAVAPALREPAGREGGCWGYGPPPFLPVWAQLPTPTTPPSAGARTSPNPVAPLAPTPRQIDSQPPPPLPQPGWGGGPSPRLPAPLRCGREGGGRQWEDGAERDGAGESDGAGRAGWGQGCWGEGPERKNGSDEGWGLAPSWRARSESRGGREEGW